MVSLKDLFITQHGLITLEDQIVDSYDLIKNIISDFKDKVNFKMKPHSSLPIIKGDPKKLNLLFMDFFNKAIGQFNGFAGEINISHIKDPKSWIFVFLTEEIPYEQQEGSIINTVGCFSKLNLRISKTPIHRQSYILFI